MPGVDLMCPLEQIMLKNFSLMPETWAKGVGMGTAEIVLTDA